MKALILVDIQNDLFPSGLRATRDKERIVSVIQGIPTKFDLVVATQDWHPADHSSFATVHGKQPGEVILVKGIEQMLWPVHCVQDTPGAQMVSGLPMNLVGKTFRKGMQPETQGYSGFFDNDRRNPTGLGDHLKQAGVIDVYVAGVATDQCVKTTALDSQRLGYRTFLIEDGCCGTDLVPGDVHRAIANMQKF